MFTCQTCGKKFKDKNNNSANVYCSRKCWGKRGVNLVEMGCNFNRWTVVGKPFRLDRKTFVPCQCKCGNVKNVELGALKNGNSKSCGCWKREVDIKRHYIHGQSYNRIYSVWKNMLKRCRDPRHKAYRYYGGRGIEVCNEWNIFTKFFEWAKQNGYSDDLSIDRTNNNGNYEPNNCKFVTWDIQLKNRRPYAKRNESISN